jgi:hypothetical protein
MNNPNREQLSSILQRVFFPHETAEVAPYPVVGISGAGFLSLSLSLSLLLSLLRRGWLYIHYNGKKHSIFYVEQKK